MWYCPHKPKSKPPRAFTLIEMLLATALSGVVMMAVLAVLGRFARRQDYHATPPDRRAVEEALLSLIEADLLNAEVMELRKAGFSLQGFGRIDERTNAIDHAPVTVVYEVRKSRRQSWLIRRQIGGGPTAVRRVRSDLLCRGVQRIAVKRALPTTRKASPPRAKGPQGVPEAVRVTVFFGPQGPGGEKRVLERILYLRAD